MKTHKAIALAGMIGVAASQAMAQTSANDSVTVTGTVQEVIAVTISGGAPAFNITPEVAVVDQNIGTVTLNSNDPDGYDVELTSANDGGILQNVGLDETIAYTVKYNGGSAQSLSSTPPLNVENVTTQTSGEETRTLTLGIEGSASQGRSAEAFSDTITVTITGKS